MYIVKPIFIVFLSAVFFGCGSLPSFDEVLPDERTEYRRSRDLPPLEIPPDLTTTTSDAMAIPGEEESASLSEFQRQRAQASGATVMGKGEFEGEQWLALRGTPQTIWPDLTQFWNKEAFELDLADPELGVMETSWKVRDDSNGAIRERFRIFTELGEEGETMVFLSSEQQLVTDGQWFDTQPDINREKEIIRAINLHFYGAAPVTTAAAAPAATSSGAASVAAKAKAELLSVDNERSYIAIPNEYTKAWREMKTVLERAGIIVQSSSVEKGTYTILFFSQESEQEEGGFFSKLKFWGDDDEEGTSYQLSLTGVGDKTEVIVTNMDGDWESNPDSKVILDTVLRYYNQL